MFENKAAYVEITQDASGRISSKQTPKTITGLYTERVETSAL